MPWSRPTLPELRSWAESEIETRLPDTEPRLRHNILDVLVSVLAGMADELYSYQEYMFRQIFPDTAEGEYLDKWGLLWGVTRKMPSFATGYVEITGKNGATIESGSTLQRADSTLYYVMDTVTITAGETVKVSVRAINTGEAGNAVNGTKLTLVSPVEGLRSETVVTDKTVSGGLDREDDASYLRRVLLRIQRPPMGGSEDDYVRWALETTDVNISRAWCYPLEGGPGRVKLRIMCNGELSEDAKAEAVKAVYNYINESSRKPVGATLCVSYPETKTLYVKIAKLSADNVGAAKEAIKKELEDMVLTYAKPGCTIYLSNIWSAINSAAGVEHFELTATDKEEGAISAANVVYGPDEIPTEVVLL